MEMENVPSASTSGTEEDDISDIRRERETSGVSATPESSPHCLIFLNIPEKLKLLRAEAYVASNLYIGFPSAYDSWNTDSCWNFYFCDDPYLKEKKAYLEIFVQRRSAPSWIEGILNFINHKFEKIRNCFPHYYVKQRRYDIDEYYIIRNIIFIIELFLRAYDQEENDVLLSHPWKIHEIRHELIKITNQLPFFIFRELYDHAFTADPGYPSFLVISCCFFASFCNQHTTNSIRDLLSSANSEYAELKSKLEGAYHFTDLVRTLKLAPCSKVMLETDEKVSSCCKHYWMIIKWILCIVISLCCKLISMFTWIRFKLTSLCSPPRAAKAEEMLEKGQVQANYFLYNAVLLRAAGVNFKVGSSRNVHGVQLDENKGEISIPPLAVDDSTELLFRNLMLCEMYYYPQDAFISSYVFLMQFLIKSVQDVDLLVEKRIIINQLGNNDAVATLFYELCKHFKLEKNLYSDSFPAFNAYSSVRHHGWIAILKLNYFSNLWTGVATVAAVILLVLTLIQTICSIISLTK